MAIAFVASGTAVDTVTTSLALVSPATTIDDVLIANISSLDNGVVTGPINWTKIRTTTNGATQQQNLFWYRTMPGDSGATWTFTVAGTTASYGVLLQYRGPVVRGSPVGQSASSANASSATITFPALSNLKGPNSLIVAAAVYNGTGVAAGAIAGANPTLTSHELDNDAVNATEALVEFDGLSGTGANIASGRTSATGAVAGINIGSYIELVSGIDEPTTGGGGGIQYAYGTMSRQRPMPGYTRGTQ